jgi:hypothetical protein
MTVTQNFTVVCPHCGRQLSCPPQLAGKRAKCKCGQSILCPTSPGQAAQAAGPTANVPLGYRTADKSAATAGGEHSALIRQAVLYSLILALIVGAVFGLRYLGGSRGGSASAKPSLGEDAKVEDMIANEDGTEAREWLAGRPGRMLSGMTSSQAEHRIDDWYRMGATKVLAFGGGFSMNVALQLPADPAKRKALFDWTNDWNARSLIPPAADVGQKYLLVRLRL